MSRALADAVITALAAEGADVVFGVPGGGPNLDKVGAALQRGMRFVLMHAETSACVAASTYGLLRSVPGVAVVTRGPGVASAVNGAAQATLDRAPLVLLSDTVPAAQAHRVPHQRLDQVALLRPATKWSGTIGTRAPHEVAAGAARLSLAGPQGAVHLAYDPTIPGDAAPAVPSPPIAPEVTIEQAVGRLAAARRPVVLIGLAAVPATAAVRRFVAAARAPALMTYQAKGVIPDSWAEAGPLFTNGASERTLLDQADLVLAVGLDPVEPIPAPWRAAAPVIAVHPWPVADHYLPADVELIGPLDDTLPRLRPHVRSSWPAEAGRRAKVAVQEALRRTADHAPPGPVGLTPPDLVAAVREGVDDVFVTVDAGAHFLFVMPLWDVLEPRDLLISNGLATMGFAVPAAIGAALARPDRRVVCFVGDGGLGMTLAELETMARLHLDVAVVVFDDAALSLIAIKQGPDHGGDAAVRYTPVDFSRVAQGLGVPAVAATHADRVRAALTEWEGGPLLVDARIEPSSYAEALRITRG